MGGGAGQELAIGAEGSGYGGRSAIGDVQEALGRFKLYRRKKPDTRWMSYSEPLSASQLRFVFL